MQTPSGHCRCKKTQTPFRHEPKTAQTANQKTLSRHLWNNLKQPQSTIFGATEHMPSLCKHHVDTADAKRPKHRAQTPKTSKLLGALPLCEGVGGYQVIALVRCIKKQLCKQKNTEHGRFAQQKHENETHMKEPGNLRGRYFQRLAVSLASRVNFGFSDEQPCSPTSSLVLPPRSCLLIRVLISGWKSII